MKVSFKSSKEALTTKGLILLALLAALSYVFERFLGIQTPIFKLHLGFLPVALAGMLYGLGPAIAVGVVADVLANIATFSLPWVALAVLEAAFYAIFLHPVVEGKKPMLVQATVAQLFVSALIHALLNTLLLWWMFHVFNPFRLWTNLLTFPVRVFAIYLLMRYRPVFEKELNRP